MNYTKTPLELEQKKVEALERIATALENISKSLSMPYTYDFRGIDLDCKPGQVMSDPSEYKKSSRTAKYESSEGTDNDDMAQTNTLSDWVKNKEEL